MSICASEAILAQMKILKQAASKNDDLLIALAPKEALFDSNKSVYLWTFHR